MSLGRYPYEVEAIADELLPYLQGDFRAAALDVVTRIGPDLLLEMSEDHFNAAVKFLGQTRSQRERVLSRLPANDAAVLLLRARYLGLASYRSLRLADRLSGLVGCSYRDAAEKGARADRLLPPPTLSDVFPLGGQRY